MAGRSLGVAIVAAITFVTAGRALADEQGWALKQGSASIGNQMLIVTPSGMKSVDPSSGVCMFTTGPDWKVVMYNDRARTYYEINMSEWKASFNRRGMKSRLDGATWKRGRQSTIVGLRAYEFVMATPPPAIPNATKNTPRVLAASYWVAADIPIPAQASSLISRFYGVPDCQRVPIKLDVSLASGQTKNMVSTVSAQRTTVPPFVRPAGYTRVKSDMDVFMDEESRKEMERMLGPNAK